MMMIYAHTGVLEDVERQRREGENCSLEIRDANDIIARSAPGVNVDSEVWMASNI